MRPDCHDQVCLTCSDRAEEATVLELLPDGLASARTAEGVSCISVELVDVQPGDVVLVHAGVAIGRVT